MVIQEIIEILCVGIFILQLLLDSKQVISSLLIKTKIKIVVIIMITLPIKLHLLVIIKINKDIFNAQFNTIF